MLVIWELVRGKEKSVYRSRLLKCIFTRYVWSGALTVSLRSLCPSTVCMFISNLYYLVFLLTVCSSLYYSAVTKHHDQKQLGRKNSCHLVIPTLQSITEGSQVGSSRQEPGGRNWRPLLTDCFPCSYFLIQPRPTCSGMGGLIPSHFNK